MKTAKSGSGQDVHSVPVGSGTPYHSMGVGASVGSMAVGAGVPKINPFQVPHGNQQVPLGNAAPVNPQSYGQNPPPLPTSGDANVEAMDTVDFHRNTKKNFPKILVNL